LQVAIVRNKGNQKHNLKYKYQNKKYEIHVKMVGRNFILVVMLVGIFVMQAILISEATLLGNKQNT